MAKIKSVERYTSIPELLSALLSTARDWNSKRVWFHGHACREWPLTPSLYRQPRTFNECSSFDAFWARGQGLKEYAHIPANQTWDWYSAARHAGLWTRLLDWSTNPLIAAYFALFDVPRDQPHAPRIWMIDPLSMNSAAYDWEYLLVPSSDPTCYSQSWLPSEVERGAPRSIGSGRRRNNHAIAVYPPYTNQRLVAQSGFFTIHGTDEAALDTQWARLKTSSKGRRKVLCAHFDLHPSLINELQRELDLFGVSVFAIYPDGEHLASMVNQYHLKHC